MESWVRPAVITALAVSMLAAAACDRPQNASADGRGVVTAVDLASHTITLDHEEIPGMMAAMTMTYHVAPDVSLDGVEPGAKVEFRLESKANAYTVTELRR